MITGRGWIYNSVCRIFFGRIECHLNYVRYIYRCTVHDLNQISNFWITHKPRKLESYPGPHELIFNALKLRLLSFKHVKRSFGMEPENYSRDQVLGTVFQHRQLLGGGGGRGKVTCSTLGCSLLTLDAAGHCDILYLCIMKWHSKPQPSCHDHVPTGRGLPQLHYHDCAGPKSQATPQGRHL